jgi:hypothetical protein
LIDGNPAAQLLRAEYAHRLADVLQPGEAARNTKIVVLDVSLASQSASPHRFIESPQGFISAEKS